MVFIVIICILTTFIITSYFWYADKQNEIKILTEQNNNLTNNLTNQLHRYIGTDEMFVGNWTRYSGNGSIFYDILKLYSNKTGVVEYIGFGYSRVTYSFDGDELVFMNMGHPSRKFSYCFLNNSTLIMSFPYLTWDMDPKAIYIKS